MRRVSSLLASRKVAVILGRSEKYDSVCQLASDLKQSVMLSTCIRELSGSNLGRSTLLVLNRPSRLPVRSFPFGCFPVPSFPSRLIRRCIV
jgi:hypothetical protein